MYMKMINMKEFNAEAKAVGVAMAEEGITSLGVDEGKATLRYAVERRDRSDDEIAEMMRRYRVLISMMYIKYFGMDCAEHVIYKIIESHEDYEKAVQWGVDFINSLTGKE